MTGLSKLAADPAAPPPERCLACLAIEYLPLRRAEEAVAVLSWAGLRRYEQNNSCLSALKAGLAALADVRDEPLRRRMSHGAWHVLFRRRVGEVAALNEKIGKHIKMQLCQRNFGTNDKTVAAALAQICLFLRAWGHDLTGVSRETLGDAPALAPEMQSAPQEEGGGMAAPSVEADVTSPTTSDAAVFEPSPSPGEAEPDCRSAVRLATEGAWAGDVTLGLGPDTTPAQLPASTGEGLGAALLAVFQRAPQPLLFEAHVLLCDALWLLMALRLRNVRANHLFADGVRARFFTPLHIPLDDLAVKELTGRASKEDRRQFAALVISASLHDGVPPWDTALNFVKQLNCSSDFIATRRLLALAEVGLLLYHGAE